MDEQNARSECASPRQLDSQISKACSTLTGTFLWESAHTQTHTPLLRTLSAHWRWWFQLWVVPHNRTCSFLSPQSVGESGQKFSNSETQSTKYAHAKILSDEPKDCTAWTAIIVAGRTPSDHPRVNADFVGYSFLDIGSSTSGQRRCALERNTAMYIREGMAHKMQDP